MTCFWDAIMASLNHEDYLLLNFEKKPSTTAFIDRLKSKNVKSTQVQWNNKNISNQELDEHYEAIKCYKIAHINNGHLTSICDSFLLLLCHLLNIGIDHKFLNRYPITYRNVRNNRRILKFKNNRGHFEKA